MTTVKLNHWSYSIIEGFAKIDSGWIKSADIIQADYPLLSGMVAALLKRTYGKPFIQNVPGDVYAEINQPLAPTAMSLSRKKILGSVFRFVANAYTKFAFSNADNIVTDGPDLTKTLIDHGIPANKIVAIPNGIDTDFFRPTASSDFLQHFFQDHALHWYGKKIVLFMGRLSAENGAMQFLKIIESLDNVVGVVVGGEPLMAEMKKYVKDHQMEQKVFFTGMLPREQVPSVLTCADLCIFPLVRIGGVSMVVPEAMAMGKCVVTTNAGSNDKLIKHWQNGFITDINDLEALTKYSDMLLSNSDLTRRIGDQAHDFIKSQWSWNCRIKDYINLYQNILSNSSVPTIDLKTSGSID